MNTSEMAARIATLERSEKSLLAALDALSGATGQRGIRVTGHLPYDGTDFDVIVIGSDVTSHVDAAKIAGMFTHTFELAAHIMIEGAKALTNGAEEVST